MVCNYAKAGNYIGQPVYQVLYHQATNQDRQSKCSIEKPRWELHAQAVLRAPVVMLMGSVPLPSLKSGHASLIVSVSNQKLLLIGLSYPSKQINNKTVYLWMSIYNMCIIDADVLCCVCVVCIFNILT